MHTFFIISKSAQLICDIAQVIGGLTKYFESVPNRKHVALLEIVSGIAKLTFSSIDVDMRLEGSSNLSMSKFKIIECGMNGAISPIDIYLGFQEYSESPCSFIIKIITPIISVAKAGGESLYYNDQYLLQLSPEDLSKNHHLVHSDPSNPDSPIVDKPWNIVDCQNDLEQSEQTLISCGIVENILRSSNIAFAASSIYRLYLRLILGHTLPAIVSPSPTSPFVPPHCRLASSSQEENESQEIFNLTKYDQIPLELYNDPTLSQFKCRLSGLPIRFPYKDPTVPTQRKVLYDYKNILMRLSNESISPETGLPLKIEQLQHCQAIQKMIDHVLIRYSTRLCEISQTLSPTIEIDEHLLSSASAEAPHLDEEKN